jgi:hypothetical protein
MKWCKLTGAIREFDKYKYITVRWAEPCVRWAELRMCSFWAGCISSVGTSDIIVNRGDGLETH